MIMMVKAPGSHKGSLATVEEGGGEWREKGIAIEVDVGVGGAKSEMKVENRQGHECGTGDFSECVREITCCWHCRHGHHRSSQRSCRHRHSRLQRSTSTFSLSTLKQEEGRRAEGLEEALRYDA